MVRSTTNKIQGIDRRGLLKVLGAAGALKSLPEGFAGVAGAKEDGETRLLGGFESGRDGWKTNGGNELHIVDEDSFPPGVTQGAQALGVRVSGDPFPHVWKKDVRNVDFEAHPYFVGNVLATTFDNDADVVFRIRYHYGQTGGGGNQQRHKRSGNGKKDGEESNEEQNRSRADPVGKPNVVESPKIRVEQLTPSTLHWDMSGLPDGALADPARIEVAWYPADHPPETGVNGRDSASSYDYRGGVVFDNVRVTNDPNEGTADAMPQTFDRLQSAHGPVEEVVTDRVEDDDEYGRIVFGDGTQVSYTFETVGGGRYRFELNGESFKLGGGWA